MCNGHRQTRHVWEAGVQNVKNGGYFDEFTLSPSRILTIVSLSCIFSSLYPTSSSDRPGNPQQNPDCAFMQVEQQNRMEVAPEALRRARSLFPSKVDGATYLNHAGTSPLSTRSVGSIPFPAPTAGSRQKRTVMRSRQAPSNGTARVGLPQSQKGRNHSFTSTTVAGSRWKTREITRERSDMPFLGGHHELDE